MRKARKISSLLLVAVSCLLGKSASAEPITFTPDTTAGAPPGSGTLVGQIPVKAIGSIALPQGLAVISGHSIEIDAVPEWLFDRDAVLTGVVVDTSLLATGANMQVSGLAYFSGGQWLRNLAAPTARDTIELKDGSTIYGETQAVLPDGLEILAVAGGRRKVAYSDITNIVSPRAFRFAANAKAMKLDASTPGMMGDAGAIAFVPARQRMRINAIAANVGGAKVPKSKLPGTEGGVPNSVIAAQVAIDLGINLVAPAITLPVVLSNPDTNAHALLKHFADFELGYPVPSNPLLPSPLSPNPGTYKIP
ncbi:MAG TPA: hypothetical protein V6C81_30385 [Planktothrix sp.]|jgi:hypothetical protein